METIALKIKQIRKELSLTQKEFSEKIGIERSLLSHIEIGDSMPSIEFYSSIAKIFRINLNWLITGEGNMLVNDVAIKNNNSEIIEHLKDEIKLKDSEIKELNRELGKKELLIEQLKNNQRISYGNLTPSIK